MVMPLASVGGDADAGGLVGVGVVLIVVDVGGVGGIDIQLAAREGLHIHRYPVVLPQPGWVGAWLAPCADPEAHGRRNGADRASAPLS
jgi:hypothetical protein